MTRGSEVKGAVYYGKKKQILGFCSSRSSGGSSSVSLTPEKGVSRSAAAEVP